MIGFLEEYLKLYFYCLVFLTDVGVSHVWYGCAWPRALLTLNMGTVQISLS